MSLTLTIKLTPPAEAVAARVEGFPARMMARMVEVLDLQNQETAGHVAVTKLSQRGSMTLGVVTNRLRPSVRPRPATLSGLTVVSSIGSNVKYAAAHEFGFSGTVTVRAHERRFANVAGGPTQFQGARKSISMRDAASLRQTKKKKVALDFREGVSHVKQHSMKMDLPARAPIRRGIEERLPSYREAMSAAVLKEWEKA